MINPTNSPYTGAESFTPSFPMALGSQGALTNNIGARPLADPTALSDKAQPIQDTTELSPDAQRDIQASSAGSSGAFFKDAVKKIALARERMAASQLRTGSTNPGDTREWMEAYKQINNMSASERRRIFTLLTANDGRQTYIKPYWANPVGPPPESQIQEVLSSMRARAKELLDGAG